MTEDLRDLLLLLPSGRSTVKWNPQPDLTVQELAEIVTTGLYYPNVGSMAVRLSSLSDEAIRHLEVKRVEPAPKPKRFSFFRSLFWGEK